MERGKLGTSSATPGRDPGWHTLPAWVRSSAKLVSAAIICSLAQVSRMAKPARNSLMDVGTSVLCFLCFSIFFFYFTALPLTSPRKDRGPSLTTGVNSKDTSG